MKKNYENAKLFIIGINAEDVLTASPNTYDPNSNIVGNDDKVI